MIGFANNRRVWDVDLDNPGSSTRRGTSLPNDLNHVGGVYRVGGQIYLIGNSNTFGPGLYTFDNGATSVTRVGSFPSAVGGSVAGAVLIGDEVYFADVFATPDVLYRMTDPTDPSSAVRVDQFLSGANLRHMAVVSTQLTTDFVPEGVRNLYFTNARADARVNHFGL